MTASDVSADCAKRLSGQKVKSKRGKIIRRINICRVFLENFDNQISKVGNSRNAKAFSK